MGFLNYKIDGMWPNVSLVWVSWVDNIVFAYCIAKENLCLIAQNDSKGHTEKLMS